MIARDDFTDDEWFRLRAAPRQVASGVVEADPSGGLSTERELHTVDRHLARVADQGADATLVRLVVTSLNGEGPAPAWPAAGPPVEGPVPDRVVAAMEQLRTLLEAKAPAAEAAGFCAWLVEIATDTAEAAKEGTAGLTGPRVSDAEAAFLTRLRSALGGV